MSDSRFQNNITETDREWFFFNSWREVMATDKQARTLVERYIQRPEFELYDTIADPNELTNLAGLPDQQARLQSLKRELDSWMASQGDKGIETELKAPERAGKFERESSN